MAAESWNWRGGRIRDAFIVAAGIAGELVCRPAVAEAWDKPSVLRKWSVRGLAGHMFWQEFALPGMLDAPVPTEPVIPLREYYLDRVTWLDGGADSPVGERIRQGGEAAAADGHAALRREINRATADLWGMLPDVPASRPVHIPTWGDWSLELDDLLLTRMLELVVHSDDLACSVGLPAPEFPEYVTAPVIELLTRLSVRRHGPLKVVRALARDERAPGSISGI
ncbi:maleylpyruvate isomerase N-terminal domain-containing protein [Streptomyces sp. NPDC057257]|uniref:maleylpyruvate isomerase N-terminal domain-containing protein n=1 Tax=Streptomyces sp. NPDC057257 TaxID=3346071 RepID=UPI00363ABD83